MLKFLIRAFAIYRISRMIAIETGPFRIFARLRPTEPQADSTDWIAEGLNCPLCLSIYVSILVMVLPERAVLCLALSGAASWLYSQERATL